MWIRQLDVTDCAGIKAASVSFQQGLNVLYGPNELGKSTLVQAVRAALVLQASATEAGRLRSWNVDGFPTVELTFNLEEQRIWRVRKRFVKGGGFTYLELSRDGKTFSQEGKGKGVDGWLQDTLRWGIKPPGGKGGKKGMQSSFITTALLGDQRDINAILESSLEKDAAPTGTETLTKALQALAEDPRFKKVLADVRKRVAEAFTPMGGKKKAKDSPFKVLEDDIKAAEIEEQTISKKVEQSRATVLLVAELQRKVLDGQIDAEEAARRLKAARITENRRGERATAEKALVEAKDGLEKAHAQVRVLNEKVDAVAAAETQTEALRERSMAAEQALAAVTPLAKAAAERVQQLQSGDAEQGRQLREQAAKNKQLKLTQQQAELEAKVKAAQEIADREEDVLAMRADVQQRTKALEEQRSLLADAKAKTTEDASAIEALERERACTRYLTAKDRAEALTAERDSAKAHAKAAQNLEDQAQEARAKAKGLNAPAQAELDELKKLHADGRVANAKLAVGLSLEFTPENTGTADVTQDGETSERPFNAGNRLRFEAQRELRLAIDGVGILDVRGGSRQLRDEAQDATNRWQRLADSLFDRAGVATSADLEGKRKEADQLLSIADQHDSEAKQARARSENVDELEQQAAVAEAEAVQRQQAAAKRLDGGSLEDYIREHEELRGDGELAEAIEALKGDAHKRDSLATKLASRTELEAAQLENFRQDLDRKQQALRDAAAENEEWHRVLAEAEADGQRLDEELAKAATELQAIQAEATAEAEDAREALAKITEEERAKKTARDEATQSVQNAVNALAGLQGEAKTMRSAVAALDVPALQAAHDEKQAILDALPEVDDARNDLAELERLATDAANQADSLRHDLSTAQGALGQVGGLRVEEQAAQAKEALTALARREHELEVEYGGWKLLLDTLAEAEREDATHLGDALVKPVSEHMAALTNGRYSEVGIGPQLDATGIRLGDDERSFDDVSVGTREQIALLLRLAIAEALGSFVILDDHLTQSDPGRMAWIRGLLAEAAQKIQVVVMTCHPEAYLAGAATDVYGVDLTKCIERYEVGA